MTARHASPLEALLVDDRFDGDVYPGEPLSRHTTYRIGGPARFYVQAGCRPARSRAWWRRASRPTCRGS